MTRGILLVFLCLAASALAKYSTYYLAPEGDDVASCGTQDKPCRTLNAITKSETFHGWGDGDRVELLSPGFYYCQHSAVTLIKNVNDFYIGPTAGWNFTEPILWTTVDGSACVTFEDMGNVTIRGITFFNFTTASSRQRIIHATMRPSGIFRFVDSAILNSTLRWSCVDDFGSALLFVKSGTFIMESAVISNIQLIATSTTSLHCHGSAVTLFDGLRSEVNNCLIQNSSIVFDAPGSASGGAIYFRPTNNGTISILNTTFFNNSIATGRLRATARGGALSVTGPLRSRSSITIVNSTILSNHVATDLRGYGGAFNFVKCNIAISGSLFRGNYIAGMNGKDDDLGAIYAGALSITEADIVSISNSTFSLNEARIPGSTNHDVLRNSAYGGAVTISQSHEVSLHNVYMDHNHVNVAPDSRLSWVREEADGGALAIERVIHTEVAFSTFFENHVLGVHRGLGGAIHARGDGTLSILNSILNNNHVRIQKPQLRLPESLAAGGAIYLVERSNLFLHLNNVSFANNFAMALPRSDTVRIFSLDVHAEGGAISTSNINATACTFLNNSVMAFKPQGGAIFYQSLSSKNSSLYQCDFISNRAESYASSLKWDSIPQDEKMSFSSSGGALLITNRHQYDYDHRQFYRVIFLESTVFTNNSASYGSAIATSSQVALNRTTLFEFLRRPKAKPNIFGGNRGNSSVIFFLYTTDQSYPLLANLSHWDCCTNSSTLCDFHNNSNLVASDKNFSCASNPISVTPNAPTVLTWPGRSFPALTATAIDAFGQKAFCKDMPYVTQVTVNASIMKARYYVPRIDFGELSLNTFSVVIQQANWTYPVFKYFREMVTYSIYNVSGKQALEFSGCPPNFLNFTSTNVTKGKPDMLCVPCKVTEYSFDSITCNKCPQNNFGNISCMDSNVADISEVFAFTIKPGYFFEQCQGHKVMIPCPNPNACMEQRCVLGISNFTKGKWKFSKEENCNQQCLKGYYDRLCSRCTCQDAECFFPLGSNCVSCASVWGSGSLRWFSLLTNWGSPLILMVFVTFFYKRRLMMLIVTMLFFILSMFAESTLPLVYAYFILAISAHSSDRNNPVRRASEAVPLKILIYFWETSIFINQPFWNTLKIWISEQATDRFRNDFFIPLILNGSCFRHRAFFRLTDFLGLWEKSEANWDVFEYYISVLEPFFISLLLVGGFLILPKLGEKIRASFKGKPKLPTSPSEADMAHSDGEEANTPLLNQVSDDLPEVNIVSEEVAKKFRPLETFSFRAKEAVVLVLYIVLFYMLAMTISIFDCSREDLDPDIAPLTRFYQDDARWVLCDLTDNVFRSEVLFSLIFMVFFLIFFIGYCFILKLKSAGVGNFSKIMRPHWTDLLTAGYKPELWWFEIIWCLRRIAIAVVHIFDDEFDIRFTSYFYTALISTIFLAWAFLCFIKKPFVDMQFNVADFLCNALVLITVLTGTHFSSLNPIPDHSLAWILLALHIIALFYLVTAGLYPELFDTCRSKQAFIVDAATISEADLLGDSTREL